MKNKSLLRAIEGQNPEAIQQSFNEGQHNYPLCITIYHNDSEGQIYNEDKSRYFDNKAEAELYYQNQYPSREILFFHFYIPQPK